MAFLMISKLTWYFLVYWIFVRHQLSNINSRVTTDSSVTHTHTLASVVVCIYFCVRAHVTHTISCVTHRSCAKHVLCLFFMLSLSYLMLRYQAVSCSTRHFEHYEGSMLDTLFLWHTYPVLVHFLFTQLRVHSAATYYPYTKHKSRDLGILNFYKPVTIMLSAKNIIQLLVFFSFAY